VPPEQPHQLSITSLLADSISAGQRAFQARGCGGDDRGRRIAHQREEQIYNLSGDVQMGPC
jgi:hypothetical protein